MVMTQHEPLPRRSPSTLRRLTTIFQKRTSEEPPSDLSTPAAVALGVFNDTMADLDRFPTHNSMLSRSSPRSVQEGFTQRLSSAQPDNERGRTRSNSVAHFSPESSFYIARPAASNPGLSPVSSAPTPTSMAMTASRSRSRSSTHSARTDIMSASMTRADAGVYYAMQKAIAMHGGSQLASIARENRECLMAAALHADQATQRQSTSAPASPLLNSGRLNTSPRVSIGLDSRKLRKSSIVRAATATTICLVPLPADAAKYADLPLPSIPQGRSAAAASAGN